MTFNAARVAGLLAPAPSADTPDEELVRRFVVDRDEPSFVALVRRHGSMVYGVCRRVLRDEHLAEDAFQAAFLVLARRASAINPPGAVAGWLHGVAFRVAKDARRSAMRRSNREQTVGELPDAAAPGFDSFDDGDVRAIIDDELRKMPAKYRELLVACDLEGQARQPVAAALGIPEGTLSSRLTAARRMLAERLTRRGIAPAIAALVATGGSVVEACEVPPVLLASAARIGSDTAGAVPAPIAALADGAIRAMTTSKLTIATLGLVAVALCALGAAYASGLLTTPPNKPEPPKAAPIPLAEKSGPGTTNRILYLRDGKLATVDPDGKNEKEVSRERGLLRPTEAKLSPDGKRVAVLIKVEIPNDPLPDELMHHRLYVRELGEKEPGTDMGISCETCVWSADGTQIAYTGAGETKPGEKKPPIIHGIVTLATKKTTPLKLPDDHVIIDWSRDGKFFLTVHGDGGDQPALHLVNRDGTEHKALTDAKEQSIIGRLSPDGKKVLYLRVHPEMRLDGKTVPNSVDSLELRVLDIATGKSVGVGGVPKGGDPTGLCWSPDGKRIAYTWREVKKFIEGNPEDQEYESQLIVCDADGKNASTLTTWKAKDLPPGSGLNEVDWR